MTTTPSYPARQHVPRPSRTGIPLRAHFIWFGQQFPWVNVLAVRSAALRGGFSEVVLHHDSDLSQTPFYRELVETPLVRLSRLDLAALWERCAPFSRELGQLFSRLRTPATRSDAVRYSLLYSEGGVYLDIDTVTLRPVAPLCAGVTAFCGQERIVYPASVRRSRDPRIRLAAFGRSNLRSVLRMLPNGWRAFRRVEHLYPLAVNPAVLASSARGPFISEAMRRMIALPPASQPRPNVIGPHLLQGLVASECSHDIMVHPPETFFPLGPEISTHWFRKANPEDLARIVAPSTCLVHWYGSVRTKHLVAKIDPDYVRAHARQQLFSALALPFA